MSDIDMQGAPAAKNIIIASVVAFVVAMLVLVSAILPAEYGVDPLGTGELLGLSALSRTDAPLEEQPEQYKTDFVEFILEPFQSVEYKYLLDMDAPMLFNWVADGEVYYDMHAEPAGLGEEYAESFEQGNALQKSGAYHAPFTGIHGWFWENRSGRTTTITLHSSGFYINGTVFQDGGSYDRSVTAPTP